MGYSGANPPGGYNHRLFTSDMESLYDHLLDLRSGTLREDPQELLGRFRLLFAEGLGAGAPEVTVTFERMLNSQWFNPEFCNLLNRSAYILINHWLQDPKQRQSVRDIVQAIAAMAEGNPTAQKARKLHKLLQNFVKTEHYKALERRAYAAVKGEDHYLRSLIHSYPMLYKHYLLDFDVSESGPNAIRELQVERERALDEQLWKTASQPAHQGDHFSPKLWFPNSTLQEPKLFQQAVQGFAGKVEGDRSYRQLATGFLQQSEQISTYAKLKDGVREYLISGFQYSRNPRYSQREFQDWLDAQLHRTLIQSESQRPSQFLLRRTCAELLEMLLADPAKQPKNHVLLTNFVDNLGATFAMGFLVKIILLCKKVKADVEALKNSVSQKLATIFKFHEASPQQDLGWFIECLDHWMLASTIQFGRRPHSDWQQIVA